MKSGKTESKSEDAFRENCTAAKLLADLFATSYGPAGMYKLVVDDHREYAITKNVETLAYDVASVHPIVRILVEAGRSVKKVAGDGFVGTITFASRLIERAWRLTTAGFSRATISLGYNMAKEKAVQLLAEYSKKVSCANPEDLITVARSCLMTKMEPGIADIFSRILVQAFLGTAKFQDGFTFDREMLKVETRVGGSLTDTVLVNGVALHKRRIDRLMPSRVENARIALVQTGLSIERPDMFTKVVLSDRFSMNEFYNTRWGYFEEQLRGIVESGANVVLCAEDIAEELRRPLANLGIIAVRNVSPQDMKILAHATGATITLRPSLLSPEKLGYCQLVEERVVAALDRWLFFEGCSNGDLRTVLIRGPSDKQINEAKKAFYDCLKTLEVLAVQNEVVPGGGATELKLASALRVWSLSLPGKEQEVILAFADELEMLAALLWTNSGCDKLSILADLRKFNMQGIYGFDAVSRSIVNPLEKNLWDPAFVKRLSILTAAETACAVIRIDHNIVHEYKVVRKSPIPEPVRALRSQSNAIRRIGYSSTQRS